MQPHSSLLQGLASFVLFTTSFLGVNLALAFGNQNPDPPCHDARCNCIAGVSASTTGCATVSTLNVVAKGGCCANLTYGCNPQDCRFSGKIRLSQTSGGGCATIDGFCAGSACSCASSGKFVFPVSQAALPCGGGPTTFLYTGCTSAGAAVGTVTVYLTCGTCN